MLIEQRPYGGQGHIYYLYPFISFEFSNLKETYSDVFNQYLPTSVQKAGRDNDIK